MLKNKIEESSSRSHLSKFTQIWLAFTSMTATTQEGDVMYFLGVDSENYSKDVKLVDLYRIPQDVYLNRKVK